MEKLTEWQAGEVQLSYKRKSENKQKVVCAQDCAHFFRSVYGDAIEHREQFIVAGLNRANKITSYFVVSSGGVSSTVVDPKLVMQYLLLANCSGFIVSHNHPSGTVRPSSQDRALTRQLVEAGKILDIPLLDHVIITANSHYGFADHGEI